MNQTYIIISPARNEEKFIESTIQSVIQQSVRPSLWIIVNDGSKDGTALIVNKYCEQFNWIRLINLPDRGYAKYGSGVVEAFYKGFDTIKDEHFDFVVKLDCDLSFEKYYFQKLLTQFSLDPLLGIASGHTYLKKKDKLIWEDAPLDHTRGPSKVYKKECFNDIGGLQETLGWDNIDEVTARMKGWKTISFPELKLTHLRQLGSTIGIIKGNKRHGYTDYITGYHPLYFFIKTIYRLFSKPYIIGALASFWGYFTAFLLRKKRPVSKAFVRHIRKEQRKKLLAGSFWKNYLNKYNVLWGIGLILSALIYYSGIFAIYRLLCRIFTRNKKDLVLTYHHVNDNTDPSISVKKRSFTGQMDYLKKNFVVTSLDEIIASANSIGRPRVAITFDDGYADFYTNAFPVLEKEGMPACNFVTGSQIDIGDEFLFLDQIHELMKSNITIGSHTMNHLILATIPDDQARDEILNSKAFLESLTKTSIKYFAYPRGKRSDFLPAHEAMAEEAGYKAAFSTINGSLVLNNMMRLNRIGIRECPLFVFKLRVSGLFESRLLLAIRRVFNFV